MVDPSRDVAQSRESAKLRVWIDVACVIFIAYFPFVTIWTHYDPVPPKPLPFRIVLLIADVFPCVFAIFWLLFRYMETIKLRFPFIRTFFRSPLYKALALLIIGLLTILVENYWR